MNVGPAAHAWKGGRKLLEGYVAVYAPDHPHRYSNKYVFEHRLMVEKALGHILPRSAVVHHVNNVRTDNRNDNFAVLENRTEHLLLHMRLRILRAGGNPWTEHLCPVCGPKDRSEFRGGRGGRPCGKCIECRRKRDKRYYIRIGAANRRAQREAARG